MSSLPILDLEGRMTDAEMLPQLLGGMTEQIVVDRGTRPH